jgi:ribose transport system substrate-binding protein
MKTLRFVVSLITKDNDFQMEQASSARAAAGRLGVEAEIVFADGNAITQSTQVLKHIQAPPEQRPAGIIVEPVGGTAMPQVARAAAAAGIGWAVLNREADYIAEVRRTSKTPVFSVSNDQREVGEIQARQFAALLPQGGALLYIQGPSDHFATRERTAGMQALLLPSIQVSTLRAQWTEESARRCIESWLSLTSGRKTNIALVAAQNDAMAVGARKALLGVAHPVEREAWLAVPYTGVDGVPSTGQAWVRAGTLKATVITPPTAGEAITLMVQALQRGVSPPERSFLGARSFPPIDKLSPAPAEA